MVLLQPSLLLRTHFVDKVPAAPRPLLRRIMHTLLLPGSIQRMSKFSRSTNCSNSKQREICCEASLHIKVRYRILRPSKYKTVSELASFTKMLVSNR
jgi:hypothetical protein